MRLKLQGFEGLRWRTTAILKIKKPYLSNGLTDWHSDVYWPSEPHQQLKFQILQIQDSGWPPSIKLKKWPHLGNTVTDQHKIWHILTL